LSHYADSSLTVHIGDCREVMAEMEPESVHCVVTSPPYWGLRDYGVAGQLGLEATPEEYVAAMVDVFREVRRVLRADGTVWLNLGDSYTGSGKGGNPDEGKQATNKGSQSIGVLYGKTGEPARQAALTNVSRRWTSENGMAPKNLVGIPWRVAFALQADGWYLRSDIIWSKPNPMPESVTDRPTKAHEYLFLLAKSPRYYFDADAVRERAESGPSDLRKMAEGRERIGGLVKEQTDPLLKASALTNIGRKRSVGGRPLGTHGEAAPDSDRQTAGARMGRGAGWRDDPSTTPVGRNLRSVWTIATQPYPGAHFATFPEKLVEPCVKAGCPPDGTVLDPFAGSGTVGRVANRLGRRAILIDLSAEYIDQAMLRNAQAPLGLGA
jgi:DNA modification methylase